MINKNSSNLIFGSIFQRQLLAHFAFMFPSKQQILLNKNTPQVCCEIYF